MQSTKLGDFEIFFTYIYKILSDFQSSDFPKTPRKSQQIITKSK